MSMFYVLLANRVGVDPGDPLPSIRIKQSNLAFPNPNISGPMATPADRTLAVYRIRDGFVKNLASLLPRDSGVVR